jgi:23S rRNA (uracil1939-C5)-methyltransferase
VPAHVYASGDEFEAACTGLDPDGAGIVFLSAGDETLRVHLEHVRQSVREAWGEMLAIREPSPERVAPICSVASACGACTLMPLAYPAQLVWKREQVVAQFDAYPELKGIAVEDCIPSPRTAGYRNQAKYVYGPAHESGKLVLGAYGRRSHRIVDLAGCCLVEPVLEDARRALLAILIEGKVAPFDEVRRTGVLRYVVMHATGAGEVLVTLVASQPDWQDAASVALALARACAAVVGVVLNVNASAGNALLADQERPLWGRTTIEDSVGDVRVRLSSRSFFQVNREVATRIYQDVVALAPASITRAVDVYAGAAGFALSLAGRSREVVAIEENPAAVQTAGAFIAELATTEHLRLVTDDAAHGLAGVDAADFVVLNPPRKGCAATVLAEVLRLRPRALAYVSCDPRTLARDLALLVRGGARIERAIPYDMMPHTPHVETLALVRLGLGLRQLQSVCPSHD